MTKIRAGDIVTVRIQVAEVADYATKEDPHAQQVRGRMLPRGDHTGWLVPQEAAVTLTEPSFKVGDEIYIDKAQSQRGRILALLSSTGGAADQLWVMPIGEGKAITVTVEPWLRRL